MITTNTKVYLPIGPDELPPRPDGPPCTSESEAWVVLGAFVKRYEQQGYYKDAHGDRIPLDQLLFYCRVEVRWQSKERDLSYDPGEMPEDSSEPLMR